MAIGDVADAEFASARQAQTLFWLTRQTVPQVMYQVQFRGYPVRTQATSSVS
jgi:hypothetical protein